MSESRIRAEFIEGGRGRIFVFSRRPARDRGHAVLVVPPFAEEMNKSRKMFNDVAQALNERGIATVLPDLYGTGDSEGEFRDGDWSVWKADLAAAAAWSAGEGWPVRGMLCARLGCALGAEVARDSLQGLQSTVFWQPVLDGPRFLTQFLRLRVVASMMEDDRKETTAGLRDRLQRGDSLEVAGYELAPRLADQLDLVQLRDSVGPWLGTLHWMEVVRDVESPLPTPSQQFVDAVAPSGLPVSTRTFAGEPFWSSTEIVRLPELVSATVRALS